MNSITEPLGGDRYTMADVLMWDEQDHRELIEGVPVEMPMPLRIHQEIRGNLGIQLANYARGKECEVFFVPLAVRLFERDGDHPEDVDTMVAPDIIVVCDPSKLDDIGCKGAPDLVMEILSPSTQIHDRVTKFNLYRRAGVREYWLVDPESRVVQSFILQNGQYVATASSGSDRLGVRVLDGCVIDLGDVFSQE